MVISASGAANTVGRAHLVLLKRAQIRKRTQILKLHGIQHETESQVTDRAADACKDANIVFLSATPCMQDRMLGDIVHYIRDTTWIGAV